MVTIRQVRLELKKHSVGIIVGAVTGIVAAAYAVNQGVDLMLIQDAGKGLLDEVMGRSEPVQVATTKLYVAFAGIGAALGYLVDVIVSRMR